MTKRDEVSESNAERGELAMAKNRLRALDSDMQVYDPPDVYMNYMDKK